MKSSYIETNVINQSLDLAISGDELRNCLEKKSLTPKFGIHGIYELARSFLDDNSRQRAISLFCILRDLNPDYQSPVDMILDQEVLKLRTGAEVLPFFDPLNQIATKQEVDKLARGLFDENARSFIVGRETEIAASYPAMAQHYIENAKKILNKKPNYKPRIFEDVLTEFKSKMPDLLFRMLRGKVTTSEARVLSHRLRTFPAIRSTAMANAYMTSISLIHNDTPGKDKIDDYRHLIEASYCDVFITGDRQLIKTVPRINPDLQVIEWYEIIKD